MCCRKYFHDNFPSGSCWNEGWLIVILTWLFSIFRALSLGSWLPWIIKEKCGRKWGYIFVDSYVVIWVASLAISLFLLKVNVSPCLFIGLITYRLFEIFQSWVGQFVLGGIPKRGWQPISKHRSLILCFVNYAEVILIFAIFALIVNDSVASSMHALYYSFKNATLIGNKVAPDGCVDYTLFYSQVMFAILFLTAVVQSIVSYKE